MRINYSYFSVFLDESQIFEASDCDLGLVEQRQRGRRTAGRRADFRRELHGVECGAVVRGELRAHAHEEDLLEDPHLTVRNVASHGYYGRHSGPSLLSDRSTPPTTAIPIYTEISGRREYHLPTQKMIFRTRCHMCVSWGANATLSTAGLLSPELLTGELAIILL